MHECLQEETHVGLLLLAVLCAYVRTRARVRDYIRLDCIAAQLCTLLMYVLVLFVDA